MKTRKTLLGTNVYLYGKEIVTQEPVYEGEGENEVHIRARESLMMLNRDKLPYFSSQRYEFYPIGK